MNIRGALERFNAKAKEKKTMISLGEKMWPDSSKATQRMNISNLVSGKTQSIKIEWVPFLCKELECTADYLFETEKTK